MNHGININERATSVSTPVVAASGIPFVVGVSPIHSATNPVAVNTPVLCSSWDEAVEKLGYSDDWEKYDLCEFMYAFFKIYGCQPAIFVNVLDVASMKEAVAESSVSVSNHKAILPMEAIGASLTVKSGASSLVKDTDYAVYYNDNHCVVELLEGGSAYSATTLSVGYNKVKISGVTASTVATAFESVELCATMIGVTPDILCAPAYSHDAGVASVMATKASKISGLFGALALVDIDSTSATDYNSAMSKKNADGMTSSSEIVCWPMAMLGDKKFHLSTMWAGTITSVDNANTGIPYESPSNKEIAVDKLVLADGTPVNLTLAQANFLNSAGIVTALNFVNGWVAWGNYTGAYPVSTDVKDTFIPVKRMFIWVANTIVKTFWSKVDKPMTISLKDNILDTCNIWLNGLVGGGYLYGARVVALASENPLTSLMAGIIKMHIYMTPPAPAQQLDFDLEYDVNYVESALSMN